MIAIYAATKSDRLIHTLSFFFTEKEEEFELYTDLDAFKKTEGLKLNYSNEIIEGVFQIQPSALLFEDGINQELRLSKKEDLFFIGDVYDPLATAFFLISRYEEYQKHEKDQHGRYRSISSQQFKLGVLGKPVADIMVKKLWEDLGLNYQAVLDKFECVPSFDIDVAWAYKGRPLWRTLGSVAKGMGDGRLKVLLNRKKDPYDTYSEIVHISTKLNRIICFSLLSDYGKYDKNISWKNQEYQSLIRGLNSSGGMGIHPGYNSFLKADVQLKETKRLEQIVGHEITKNRFHFLRYEIPKSYQILLENGIKKDYSMGYADNVGFRAGTSFPYYHFDLAKNESSNLLVFPFAYMDSALKDYLKLDISKAQEKVKNLIDEVANVGGLFMCVWHNSSITDSGEWEGWKSILDFTVDYTNKLKKS
ncbi:MAG: polysaccharide deacetylase family protein [Crocinitomicaceae bacterium]